MRIQVRDRGPLRLEVAAGETVEIVDGEGRAFGLAGRAVVSLCRCGASETKPFCDGSHNRCGFDSVVVARELPPPAPKP